MKADIKAIRNREMGNYKASRFIEKYGKLFLCIGKFYSIFLSLIAVKKTPHIRRLSPTALLLL
jgi:hypothetical protein